MTSLYSKMYQSLALALLTCFHVYGVDKEFNLSYIYDIYRLNQENRSSDVENIGLLTLSAKLSQPTKVGEVLLLTSFTINHSTGSPSRYFEDAQIVSNIDTEGGEGLKPYEVYLGLDRNRFKIQLGLIDLSSKLNITESSSSFINSSFGTSAEFGAAGRQGPAIFPIPSWGVLSEIKRDKIYFITSLTDPIADEDLDPTQVVTDPTIDRNHYIISTEFGIENLFLKKIAVGAWKLRDRGRNFSFDEQGAYIILDKSFDNFNSFLRLSRSAKRENKLYQNIALGGSKKKILFNDDSLHVGYSIAAIEGGQNQEKVLEFLWEKEFKYLTFATSLQHIEGIAGQNTSGQMLTIRLQTGLSKIAN